MGVGLLVPTLDDVAASLGIRLRKWQRSRRLGGTILCLAAMSTRLLLWTSCQSGLHDWNESWSRSWVCQCPRSWKETWLFCSTSHGSACRIVRQSLLWILQCLSSRRKACRSYHWSGCRIVLWSRLWVPPCLRSRRKSWRGCSLCMIPPGLRSLRRLRRGSWMWVLPCLRSRRKSWRWCSLCMIPRASDHGGNCGEAR